MAQIYDQPSRVLMTDWANENLTPGRLYTKNQIADWFMAIYPNYKRNSVLTDIDAMSVNYPSRVHYSVKPGSGHDLFFKEGPSQFRLWNQKTDPPPIYKIDKSQSAEHSPMEIETLKDGEVEDDRYGDTFALEKDLQNFLARNLDRLDPGLSLYKADGLSGLEFNAGGRFIDILAVDHAGDFVVIELKVSRGYDRVIGQLQRYMGWVEANLARGKVVKGIIVASEITNDLVLATRVIAERVKLFEYSLSFQIQQKDH